MATTQLAIPPRATSPLALWHLLSLDAPTVAALWTWFVARTSHIRLPLAAPAAMFLAAWILYATDRLLDARPLSSPHSAPYFDLEARHLFHRRHRRAFVTAIALSTIALAALLPRLSPAAIPLYAAVGGLLAVWFLILHGTAGAHRLPKEIAVGFFFSAAIFIPAVARTPAHRLALLPDAVLFAALCSLNCLFIYAWEHDHPTPSRPPHATTRLALAHLPAIACTVAVSAVALVLFNSPLIPVACALAAGLLLLLHRNRRHLSRTNLRAAADLTLLTPLLLLPFLR